MTFQPAGFILLTAALLLTACGAAVKIKSQPGLGEGSESASGSNAPVTGGPPSASRVVYFVGDSGEVSPESLPVVNYHANYLAAQPGKAVMLQGHTDERGAPEYNIALGERRAMAVAKLMKLQGVADSQLQTLSYGEAKPAVNGHDERAWPLNRRVEIIYLDQ